MRHSIPIAIASALVCVSFATGPQPSQAAPETAPENMLDFWVGEWDLTYKLRTGSAPDAWMEGTAKNSIRKVLDGKVILEEFEDTAPAGTGLKGMSVSVYEVATSKWRQTWVDNQSSHLDLVGSSEDGAVHFTMIKIVGGAKQLSRMVFDKIEKQSFDWTWMSSADGGKTWVDNWIIRYKRRGS